jgi:hypothetical protein
MPGITIVDTYITPHNVKRFHATDSKEAQLIKNKFGDYMLTSKVTFTIDVIPLEDYKLKIITKSIWNDEKDFNEYENWLNPYRDQRSAYNKANGIVVTRAVVSS